MVDAEAHHRLHAPHEMRREVVMIVVAVGLVVIGTAGAAIAMVREAPRFARWYHRVHHV
jgi:hypothetical protein